MSKVIKIIAGPNGSGKTTFAESFISKKEIPFLNPDIIAKRVSLGGHNIPTSTVRRRQLRCFENFWNIYSPLAEDWSILDNSKTKPKLILNLKSFDKLSLAEQTIFSEKFLKGKI